MSSLPKPGQSSISNSGIPAPITADIYLSPGVYYLPGGLKVASNDITIDGNNAVILGSGHGNGLDVQDRRRVTIRNLSILNYSFGIYAQNCQDLLVEGCRIRATDGSWGLPAPAPRRHTLRNNYFENNALELDASAAEETLLT